MTVGGTVTVHSNAVIDVTGKSTRSDGVPVNVGASHGGLGGAYYQSNPNTTYGNATNPVAQGTCALGSYSRISYGGGLARISAQRIVVDGGITANGEPLSSISYFGGGSGGAIMLNAGSIEGNGRITANGASVSGYASSGGGGGGGGRIALHYWDGVSVPASNIYASGGIGLGDGRDGAEGTVITNNKPIIAWQDEAVIRHGDMRVVWPIIAANPTSTTARATLSSLSNTYVLANGTPIASNLVWDTTQAVDGLYTLGIEFFDAGDVSLGAIERSEIVNNSDVWHGGTIQADEVWSNSVVHLLEGTCYVADGVTVTIESGTVVKATGGAQLYVENGGTLNALGTEQQPIVMTSLADDTVGGDTLHDGGLSIPQPGDWLGVNRGVSGTLNVNDYLDLRYIRLTRSGTLTEDQTWLGNAMYVVEADLTVPDGRTLSIEPGAIIKFATNTSIIVSSGGTLQANGSVAKPILFTSIYDNTAGGDSDGDEDETTPYAGDWHWIYVNGGSAVFDHCELRYGGGSLDGGWGTVGRTGEGQHQNRWKCYAAVQEFMDAGFGL